MKVACFQYIRYSQESDLEACSTACDTTSDCLQEATALSTFVTERLSASTAHCLCGTGGVSFCSYKTTLDQSLSSEKSPRNITCE